MATDDLTKLLREEYTIETPENVTFGYEVAGIGARFIAALIDTVLLGVGLLLLNILLAVLLSLIGSDALVLFDLEAQEPGWIEGLVIALYALLNFAVLWGYYILFELLWNGQTPGKRVAKIRVVRLDGSPIGFIEAAVRNLVRIVDFFPMGYGVGFVTMFLNRRARRLGDFAAGTLVIRDQGTLSLATISRPPTAEPAALPQPAAPTREPAWLDVRRLSAADYELAQTALARYQAGQIDLHLLRRVAGVIATKVGQPPSSEYGDAEAGALRADRNPQEFLKAVVVAYQAQTG